MKEFEGRYQYVVNEEIVSSAWVTMYAVNLEEAALKYVNIINGNEILGVNTVGIQIQASHIL